MFFQTTFTLPHLFLCLDVLLGFLAVCSMCGNGFILTLIVSRSSLRKNEGIYLITALSFADLLLAITVLPFVTLLITEWGIVVYRCSCYNVNLNYPTFKVLVLALPIVAEIKINSVLTVAIAFDRFSAIQWPIHYKLKNKGRYVVASFIIGVLWAIFDVILLFSTTTIEPKPGCAAAGCFMSAKFRYYWGESNMCINLVAMAATVFLMIKIRSIQNVQSAPPNIAVSKMISIFSTIMSLIGLKPESQTVSVLPINSPFSSDSEQDRFSHANRVAVSVLLCSGCCILLPSIFAGLGEMLGLHAFQSAGPFVAIGLVLCGFINTFIYALKHKDIRHAIRVFGVRTVSNSRTESNVGLPIVSVCRTVGGGEYVIDSPPYGDTFLSQNRHRTSIVSNFVNELAI